MTREESKKIKEDFVYEYAGDSKVYNIYEVHKMIDKIYDDFESRTCESCKYIIGKDKQAKCKFGILPDNLYVFEFCCSK